ncbi:MAG: DUF5615 family PIN-like protein [Candidatus Woesebacteria bacterium]|nr:DUF5615 family PIN-like protein [Candidatus Woesebacteria bacterium]
MFKFLLDANLSPTTANYLRDLGFDARSITEEKLGYLLDKGVVEIAKKEGRIIITFDLDFGEIYHEKENENVGIIVLRLNNQTPENVNFVLGQFLQKNFNRLKQNTRSLIVIKENGIRFVH